MLVNPTVRCPVPCACPWGAPGYTGSHTLIAFLPCSVLALTSIALRALQAQAYNEATFREPDEDGWQPENEPIDTDPDCTSDTCLHTRLQLPHIIGEHASADIIIAHKQY